MGFRKKPASMIESGTFKLKLTDFLVSDPAGKGLGHGHCVLTTSKRLNKLQQTHLRSLREVKSWSKLLPCKSESDKEPQLIKVAASRGTSAGVGSLDCHW